MKKERLLIVVTTLLVTPQPADTDPSETWSSRVHTSPWRKGQKVTRSKIGGFGLLKELQRRHCGKWKCNKQDATTDGTSELNIDLFSPPVKLLCAERLNECVRGVKINPGALRWVIRPPLWPAGRRSHRDVCSWRRQSRGDRPPIPEPMILFHLTAKSHQDPAGALAQPVLVQIRSLFFFLQPSQNKQPTSNWSSTPRLHKQEMPRLVSFSPHACASSGAEFQPGFIMRSSQGTHTQTHKQTDTHRT